MRPENTGIGGFILAAGEGRRLRPYTCEKPKALFPFCGIPLLELACSLLAKTGLEEIVINACHLAEQVEKTVCQLQTQPWTPHLRLSRERSLLNTGGGLRLGMQDAPNSIEHILVHNADVIADVDLDALIRTHLTSGAAVTALLTPGCGPQTVALTNSGRILNFRCPPGQAPYTFSGIHILRRDVLDFLPPQECCSIIDAYEAAMQADLPVQGMPLRSTAFWADLGTPATYIRAHQEVKKRPIRHHSRLAEAILIQEQRRHRLTEQNISLRGAFGLGCRVSFPPKTALHDMIAWDQAGTRTPGPFCFGILTSPPAAQPRTTSGEQLPDPRIFSFLGLTPNACSLENLPIMGSGRRYARLRWNAQSRIWCAYSRDRRENANFARLAVFLDHLGVQAPKVDLHLPSVGEILMSDLGDQNLLSLPAGPERTKWLKHACIQIARLHVRGTSAATGEDLPLQPAFSPELYRWERDYFRQHLLKGMAAAEELWTDAVERDWQSLVTELLAQPLVLIHRDFQSSNILIHAEKTWLIDFQGMRLGAAAYDLASLLYDPYCEHEESVRIAGWNAYQNEISRLGGQAPDRHLLHVAGIQRLLQALGAYGKLCQEDGLHWFSQHIPPAMRLLAQAAVQAKSGKAFSQMLERLQKRIRQPRKKPKK